MKETCKNCHFLVKNYRDRQGKSYDFFWDKNDLANEKISDHYSPSCSLGVWDAGIDPSLNNKLKEILNKDRKDFCFFIKKHPGMSIQAAKLLQERSAQYTQLKRTNIYTQIGLWIAAIALVANVFVAIAKCG